MSNWPQLPLTLVQVLHTLKATTISVMLLPRFMFYLPHLQEVVILLVGICWETANTFQKQLLKITLSMNYLDILVEVLWK